MKILLMAIFIISLTGCVSAKYSPPSTTNIPASEITLNKTYDDTWASLIGYSGSTFFSIDNYEKDSGLITLSFGSGHPAEFITGGDWVWDYGVNHFNGDYVDYISAYQGGTLNGKMNIVVTKIDESHTKIAIHSRYIFSSPTRYDNYGNASPGLVFSFDTGSCATTIVPNYAPGTQDTRTICPTYKAEHAIINAVGQ